MVRNSSLKTALHIQSLPSIENPITFVTRNKTSDAFTASLKDRFIDHVIKLKITKSTGMTIPELMQLTPYDFNVIRESIIRVGKRDAVTTNTIVDELENN